MKLVCSYHFLIISNFCLFELYCGL